jgi:hypothetical protein
LERFRTRSKIALLSNIVREMELKLKSLEARKKAGLLTLRIYLP